MNCVTKMKSIYPEAVDIVVKGYLPSDIDNNILYEIKENNYAVLYPNSTAKFITALLNAGSSFINSRNIIENITEELKGLSLAEQNNLNEAMLKHNIQV